MLTPLASALLLLPVLVEPLADETHWAYVPPSRPAPPASTSGWGTSPIDAFVEARLAALGLAPSPAADRRTLLRRASLDLIGLPPTPEDVEAFVADTAPDAFERQVDRLLASPHFGERWARLWLDLARYADTHGYEKDSRRTMWRWRDWVIDAFNRDLPFDTFTIEQLAGDLLPDPTIDQLVATGFHRNTMINQEGGVDPEEFRVAAVVDRVNTTAAVWLGSTLDCAQCHDHKFDPVTQREYFELYAFFDQTEDNGSSEAPKVEAPTPAEAAERDRVEAERGRLASLLETQTPALDAELAATEAARDEAAPWVPLVGSEARGTAKTRFATLEDGSLLAFGEVPGSETYEVTGTLAVDVLTSIRLEVMTDPSLPTAHHGPGRTSHGNFVLNELTAALVNIDGTDGTGETETPLTLTDARADFFQKDRPWPAAHTIDGDAKSGWAIGGEQGVAHRLEVSLATPVADARGRSLRIRLRQEYGSQHLIGRFALSVHANTPPPVIRPDLEPTLARAKAERSPTEQASVEAWFRSIAPSLADTRAALAALKSPPLPTVMILRDRKEPRETRVHRRGAFLDPGSVVTPGTPAALGPAPDGATLNRLDLARWLTAPDHPLTARVTVNRFWAELFGDGLVKTENDFGVKGDAPTHPALLDWLARSFVDDGFSVKRLLKTIVTSATYRQTSRVDAERLAKDPFNRLLTRGPRYRIDAEMVRDLALSVSGLLSPTIGGPSVFPPQPDGIWNAAYSGDRWNTAQGDARVRRGLYTFWRRTSPYPTFMLFDAPSREVACTRRGRSNTPLQALALLNDPAFIEAARALADRMIAESGMEAAARIDRGFALCTSRPPEAAERDILLSLFEEERARYEADPAAAETLGENAERCAWIAVANALLNLDETVTNG